MNVLKSGRKLVTDSNLLMVLYVNNGLLVRSDQLMIHYGDCEYIVTVVGIELP